MRRSVHSSTSAPITPVPFDNAQHPGLPIEVLSFEQLRRMAPDGYLARPQRPAFHQLQIVTRGRCTPEVDFTPVALKRGVVAWIRAGQVLRLDVRPELEGWLLLFTADVLEADLADDDIGSRIELTGRSRPDVDWLLACLRRTSAQSDEADRLALLRHLLHALLLIVRGEARCGKVTAPRAGSTVLALFRREVDRRFAETRRVEDYERLVGYSAKTLTRATQAALGLTAKEYVDQRVLLESRRLLAHTDLGIGEIAQRVGFSELTNFIKFFRRAGGELPTEFRARGARRANRTVRRT